jgi:acetoin utilization deacetylase AcuC-like enzyme
VIPAARAFAPDLVLVSAGFDAHRADPLADCLLETSIVLEGGYEPVSLARSVRETMLALGDDRAPRTASAELVETRLAVAQLQPFWPL